MSKRKAEPLNEVQLIVTIKSKENELCFQRDKISAELQKQIKDAIKKSKVILLPKDSEIVFHTISTLMSKREEEE